MLLGQRLTSLSSVCYRSVGKNVTLNLNRFLAAGSVAPSVDANAAVSVDANAGGQPQTAGNEVDEAGSRPEPRPLHFGTLEFLLRRRMPVTSVRLLQNGVRMACDERQGETMLTYLGPWLSQLTRSDILERLAPWHICHTLRDVTRLSRIVGVGVVRDALPSKHLQTLANRLVVQGFDKLTPLQLAHAAECFGLLRPFQSRATIDEAAIDSGPIDSQPSAEPMWPSSDWVDELVDWMHNLKPDVEPWPRTSCYCLSTIVYGLARSNYKPSQSTLQTVAVAMKAKLEEQLNSGYLSRQALLDSARAWIIWRVNPEDHAPGYWDIYMKNAAQIMEEYVDSVPDPPSVEDVTTAVDGQTERDPRRRFKSDSLFWKRRNFRSLLASVASVVDHFDVTEQFDQHAKSIWAKRVSESAQYLSGTNARRILKIADLDGIPLQEGTREKLTEAASRYGKRREPAAAVDQGGDYFDDGPANRSRSVGVGGGRIQRGREYNEYDDFDGGRGGGQKSSGKYGRVSRSDELDYDDKPF